VIIVLIYFSKVTNLVVRYKILVVGGRRTCRGDDARVFIVRSPRQAFGANIAPERVNRRACRFVADIHRSHPSARVILEAHVLMNAFSPGRQVAISTDAVEPRSEETGSYDNAVNKRHRPDRPRGTGRPVSFGRVEEQRINEGYGDLCPRHLAQQRATEKGEHRILDARSSLANVADQYRCRHRSIGLGDDQRPVYCLAWVRANDRQREQHDERS